MNASEEAVQKAVDARITRFKTTEIRYYPFEEGVPDIFRQQTKAFGDYTSLIGRAILRPTPEKLTVIGNGEEFDVAFLFSRLEMLRKFPAAAEGLWMKSSGQMWWWNRDYKVEHVRPTGQVGETFSLMVVLANTYEGRRDG